MKQVYHYNRKYSNFIMSLNFSNKKTSNNWKGMDFEQKKVYTKIKIKKINLDMMYSCLILKQTKYRFN